MVDIKLRISWFMIVNNIMWDVYLYSRLNIFIVCKEKLYEVLGDFLYIFILIGIY